MLVDFWKNLNWQQVAFSAIAITGVAISLHAVPPGFWDRVNWEWWLGFALAAGGAGGSALVDRLLKTGGPTK